jgi:hypothetical protein
LPKALARLKEGRSQKTAQNQGPEKIAEDFEEVFHGNVVVKAFGAKPASRIK